MRHTGPAVGLLYDTGHCAFAGGDPVALVRRHVGRIVHVHCKDTRPDVLARARAEDLSFMQAVVDGIFTVPGDGSIDYRDDPAGPGGPRLCRLAGGRGRAGPGQGAPTDLCPPGLRQSCAAGAPGRLRAGALSRLLADLPWKLLSRQLRPPPAQDRADRCASRVRPFSYVGPANPAVAEWAAAGLPEPDFGVIRALPAGAAARRAGQARLDGLPALRPDQHPLRHRRRQHAGLVPAQLHPLRLRRRPRGRSCCSTTPRPPISRANFPLVD